MTELNSFKLEYYWYEDEHEETILIKDVKREEFEKDLEAKQFAEKIKGIKIKEGKYLGKGYNIECLPEFYEQIIWFLKEKKKYKECQFNVDISYIIDDDSNKEINIAKNEKITKRTDLKC